MLECRHRYTAVITIRRGNDCAKAEIMRSGPPCLPFVHSVSRITEQEAQLSQRDRAPLRVIEYFAKLLGVIQNDTVE